MAEPTLSAFLEQALVADLEPILQEHGIEPDVITILMMTTVLEGFLRRGASQIENLSEACLRDIANTGKK